MPTSVKRPRRLLDAYAYSAAGDRQAAELGKYRQHWEKLEGREQVQKVQEKTQKIEPDNTPGMSR